MTAKKPHHWSKPADEVRTKRISVYMTSGELETLLRKCERLGISRNELINRAVITYHVDFESKVEPLYEYRPGYGNIISDSF